MPLDNHGRCWVCYEPGKIGDRSAFGYVTKTGPVGLYYVEYSFVCMHWPNKKLFSTVQSAACYLKMILDKGTNDQ